MGGGWKGWNLRGEKRGFIWISQAVKVRRFMRMSKVLGLKQELAAEPQPLGTHAVQGISLRIVMDCEIHSILSSNYVERISWR